MSISIEEQAVQTYQENLQYFQENHPNIFEKIYSVEIAIEKGYFQPRYELEYKDAGYFDVKEISTGNYLYSKNSYDYGKVAAQGTNYKKDESTFETFYSHTITEQELKDVSQYDITHNGMYATGRINYYVNKVADKHSTTMKEIKKFIFFGVGLGTHITEIDNKIHSKNYLIVEDDLELFRLSLFVTNYKNLSKNSTLFFSIFDSDDEARIIFENFLSKSFYYNHYIKYFQMLNSSDKKFRLMHTVIAEQPHLTFLFHSYFRMYLIPLKHLKNEYKFLDINHTLEDTFQNKPLLVLGAGPSLGKNIDWLKKNQDKFIILTPSATLRTLQKHNIKPDIIVHLDSFESSYQKHFVGVDKKIYEDCLLISGSQTYGKVLEEFKKENVYIFQNNVSYKPKLGKLSPICVGSASYMVAVNLGAKNIYLLGLDLALDPETNSTHINEHKNAKSIDTSGIEEIKSKISYLETAIKVKGNFDKEVNSLLTFYRSIRAISNFPKAEAQKVYNLSRGAYFKNTTPKKIKELKIKKFKKIDKQAINKLIKQVLDNKSEICLDAKELKSFHKRVDITKDIEKKLKTHSKPKVYMPQAYQEELLSITMDIISSRDKEAENIQMVYLTYMKYILPFIFDFLNTREIKNIKKHIDYLHTIMIKHYKEIVKEFEKNYVKFLDKEVVY